MYSLACLPSFPCLDAWPSTDQKRFHLGTEGDHHVFLGLLAFLPLLGCLAPYRPKTFSFRYRMRPSCIPWLACLPSLAWILGPLQTKNVFIQVQKEKSANDCQLCQHMLPRHKHFTQTKTFSFQNRKKQSCLPSLDSFCCFLPLHTKTFSFWYRKRPSYLPWLACLPSFAFIQVQKEKSANDCQL